MRRTLVVVVLIFSLIATTSFTGCESRDNPAGPAIFLATVLILGLTFGGWFHHDHPDAFPPLHYDMLSALGPKEISGTILSPGDRYWYRTELMRPGDRIKVWSESEMGLKCIVVDEEGRYYPSDNTEPGSNFTIEIQASKATSYYLEVMGHDTKEQGRYVIKWEYTY